MRFKTFYNRVKKLFKEHFEVTISIILIILIIVFGLWGFYLMSTSSDNNDYKNVKLLTILYDTIRLIIGEWNLPPYALIPWQVEVGRFSGLFLLGFTVFNAIWYFFRSNFLLSFLYKNHVVICGLGERGFALGKDFLEKGYLGKKYKVVAIEKEKQSEYIIKFKEIGGIVLNGDGSDKEMLKKAKINIAKLIIAVTGNDLSNLEIAININDLLSSEKTRKSKEQLKIYIHVSDLKNAEILIKNEIIKDSKVLENIIFNLHDNAARELFKSRPLYSTPTFDAKDENNQKQFTMLIIGFDQTGEALLRQAAKIAHFANLKKPQFIVVDSNIDQKEKYFTYKYPEIKNCSDIKFAKCKDEKTGQESDYYIKSKEFYEELITENVDYIVVCLKNDELSLNIGLNIIDHYLVKLGISEDELPIIAIKSFKQPSLTRAVSNISTTSKSILSLFGTFESICNADTIIDEKFDIMAIAVNLYYAELYQGTKEWSKIIITDKESNRANAEHIDTKLYLLGLKYIKADELNDKIEVITEENYHEYLSPKLDLLSKIEHKRWNAFHYINDWKYGNKKNKEKRIHNCLVEWDNLTEEDKNKDRDLVKAINSKILKSAGYKIVKL